MKISFLNDYSSGAHPDIIKILTETNLSYQPSYGHDSLSQQAAELIKASIKNSNAAVHFVSTGTQANLITLASMLKPYESIIAAQSAHILVHEAGAIEATGHKINAIASNNGKINAEQIKQVLTQHPDEHLVKPKVVFLSQATELGEVYKKIELENISKLCKENKLYLYIDGARLGSALTSDSCDLSLPELSQFADAFYIGGTKNGALLGEAIVINNQVLQEDFRYHLKQRGALLSKGRVLGAQFLGLFTNNLFFEIAKNTNMLATKLVLGLRDKNISFFSNSETNQIFPIFHKDTIKKLSEKYEFYVWHDIDLNNAAIRLVVNWNTQAEEIEMLLKDIS